MPRTLLLIPVCVLIVAGAGYGLCRVAGRLGHGHEALVAAVICVVAAELAALPALLSRHSDPTTVSQAGLVGTLGHMFVAMLLAAVVWMLKLAGERQAFLLWLLILYWVSLVALVGFVVQVIRRAAEARKGTKC